MDKSSCKESVGQSRRRNKIASLVVFDSETSSISSRNPLKITEMCFLSVQTDEIKSGSFPRVLNKLQLCLNPGCFLPPQINALTGLYNDHLEQMPSFQDVVPLITGFLSSQPRPLCIVAHNGNRFDFPLLKAEVQAAGHTLPEDPDFLCADSLEAFRMLDGLPAVPEWVVKREMEQHIRACQMTCSGTRNSGPKKPPQKKIGKKCQQKKTGNKHPLTKAATAQSPENALLHDRTAFCSEYSSGDDSLSPLKLPRTEDHTEEFSSQLSITDLQLVEAYTTLCPEISAREKEALNKKEQIVPSTWLPDVEKTPPRSTAPPVMNVATQFIKKGQPSYSGDEKRDRVSRRLFDNSDCTLDLSAADCDYQESNLLTAVPASDTQTVPVTDNIPHLDSQGSISNENFISLAYEVEEAASGITSPATESGARGETEEGVKSRFESQNSCTERNASSTSNAVSPKSSAVPHPRPASVAESTQAAGINREAKGACSLPESQVSYKLGEIYRRLCGSLPAVDHTAEDDCITLLHIILKRSSEFLAWTEEHAVPLDSVQPMY